MQYLLFTQMNYWGYLVTLGPTPPMEMFGKCILASKRSVGEAPKWSACPMKIVVWILTLTEGPIKLGEHNDH
ncbi:hypothetical protein H5410_056859 [Solanum commersonii]|uniref:Uncharacterized protein n=1 Tax=Solanum commersonii TaxID=4109 RepID=A0A9J5WMZ5_SOLCO|nr:hypothetical protein H5410_056859 [Solanum commersonii]